MLDIKYCEKCGMVHDFNKCPYCNGEDKIKLEVKEDGERVN